MAYDPTLPNTAQAYADAWASIRENFRAIVDGDSVWTVPKGGTGLTTIPAGRILYGNNTSAVSTSANLICDGANLGIGTAIPLSKLHVNGLVTQWGSQLGFTAVGYGSDLTNYESLTCAHAGANGAQFISSGVGTGTIRVFKWLTWDGSSAPVLMTLTAAGYLGIGTTNPLSKLHINGQVTQWGYQQGFVAVGYGSDFTNYESLTFAHAGANGAQFISSGVGTGTIRGFKWLTWDGSSVLNLMTLTPAGYLGLNTTNPIARIDVASDVNHTVQGSARVRNASTGINGMSLYYTGDSTSDYTAVFGSTGTGSTAYTGGQTGIVGTIKNIPLTVIRNNVFHSIFDTSGNLGIGTTTPAARLHVLSTAEQLRVGYDASNYGTFTAASDGTTNITSSSAASDTKAGVGIWRASFAPNNISLLLGGQSTLSYTADQAGAVLRFNGSDVIWGDLGFHPKDGSGVFHFKRTSSSYGGGGYSGIRAGTIYSMYDASNYQAITVGSTGWLQFQHSGTTPYWYFTGSGTGAAVQILLNNSNANAYGAIINFQTETTVRGYVGALKHGTASNVLFTGETADGFGIRAESVLEFGISATGVGRWNTTGLAIGSLFNPSAALHVIRTTEQLRLGYDDSKYASFTVDSSSNLAISAGAVLTFGFSSGRFAYMRRPSGASLALTTATNNIGVDSTAFGVGALENAVSTDQENSGFGAYSLSSVSYGSYNTGIGSGAGSNITTGSNNIVIGFDAMASTSTVSSEITLGNIYITTLRCQVTSITSLSDARDKKDIKTIVSALDFINDLNPISFIWDCRDGSKQGIVDSGFIAQELKAVQEKHGFDFLQGLVYESNPEKLEAAYGKLLPVMVRAIQELSSELSSIKKQLN